MTGAATLPNGCALFSHTYLIAIDIIDRVPGIGEEAAAVRRMLRDRGLAGSRRAGQRIVQVDGLLAVRCGHVPGRAAIGTCDVLPRPREDQGRGRVERHIDARLHGRIDVDVDRNVQRRPSAMIYRIQIRLAPSQQLNDRYVAKLRRVMQESPAAGALGMVDVPAGGEIALNALDRQRM
jgi:hypothetical protein